MSLSERINTLIEEKYRNGSELARVTGVSAKTINNIVNNSNSPNHSVIAKILKGIPELSAEWLIRGEGPMWRNKQEKVKESKIGQKNIGDYTLKEIIELVNKEKED